jgi:hypothetical protein
LLTGRASEVLDSAFDECMGLEYPQKVSQAKEMRFISQNMQFRCSSSIFIREIGDDGRFPVLETGRNFGYDDISVHEMCKSIFDLTPFPNFK